MPASPPKEVPAYWNSVDAVYPLVEGLPTPIITSPSPSLSDNNASSLSSYAAELSTPSQEKAHWRSLALVDSEYDEQFGTIEQGAPLGLGVGAIGLCASPSFLNVPNITVPPNSPMEASTAAPVSIDLMHQTAIDLAELDLQLAAGGIRASPMIATPSSSSTVSTASKIRYRLLRPFSLRKVKRLAKENCDSGSIILASPKTQAAKASALRPAKSLRSVFRSNNRAE